MYVDVGSHIHSVLDDTEEYVLGFYHALVISSPIRYIELDYEITGLVIVFIPEKGVFTIQENMLLSLDDLGNPSRPLGWRLKE